MIDSLTVSEEAKLGHANKLVFLGNYGSKDGSNILITVFSKAWLHEKGEDMHLNQPKSIFLPRRTMAQIRPMPMEDRLMLQKWNFEEREHLK